MTASPFDFYARILGAEGGRKAFAARLGPECFDALDEFLALAETFSARPQSSLAGFVTFARQSASEVKRETDQAAREVRIMTVHGAKGLEANIVILADTCSHKSASPAPVYVIGDGSGAPQIPVWAVKGTGGLPPVADAKAAIKAAERRELGRLLYVAMTRARDRLYIAGFHNGSLPEGCWYETIRNALAPKLAEVRDFAGRRVWRMGTADGAPATAVRPQAAESLGLPGWVSRPVPFEEGQLILSPSKLYADDVDRQESPPSPCPSPARGEGTPWQRARPAAPSPLAGEGWGEGNSRTIAQDRETAQLRGTLIHRLLEILPALPRDRRDRAARAIASAFPALPAEETQDAIDAALALLSKEALPQVWDRGVSEASLAVQMPHAAILGQADSILIAGDDVTVLDYKSGALPPDATLRRSHLAQLACYRLALQRLYPTAGVRAALLNTRDGTLVEASGDALDTVLAEIAGAPVS